MTLIAATAPAPTRRAWAGRRAGSRSLSSAATAGTPGPQLLERRQPLPALLLAGDGPGRGGGRSAAGGHGQLPRRGGSGLPACDRAAGGAAGRRPSVVVPIVVVVVSWPRRPWSSSSSSSSCGLVAAAGRDRRRHAIVVVIVVVVMSVTVAVVIPSAIVSSAAVAVGGRRAVGCGARLEDRPIPTSPR